MKKFLYIFLFLNSGLLFAQWTWLNALPQSNTLTNVIRLDNGYLLASGRCGTILLSTNDGANWNVKHRVHDTTTSIESICRVNDNLLFAASFDSRILRSTNLGMNWQNISRISTVLTNLDEILFVDQNTGIVSFGTSVYKTTNGGLNWFLAAAFPRDCEDITFLNSTTGIAVGGAVIDQISQSSWVYKTTNGGLNWFDLPIPELGPIFKVQFLSANTGYISTWNYLHKTTNSGTNWIPISIPSPYTKVTDFIFFNESTAYAGTDDARFIKTTNGGANWSSFQFPFATFNSTGSISMSFTNLNQGFILDHGHLLYKTENGGSNWNPLTSSMNLYTPLTSIEFLDENNIVLGGWGHPNDFVIRKSVNGGLNWIGILPNNPQNASGYIYDVDFPSVSTGYAVGSGNGKGYIYKTMNSGNNWSKIDSFASGSLKAIEFINNTTGFTLGYAGEIFKTTNGGSNWTTFNSGLTSTLSSICFVDQSTGYSCGGSPVQKLFKTTNTGNTWTEIFTMTGNVFSSVNFINSNTGFITGRNIFKSTDAGLTWIQKTQYINVIFQKTSFPVTNVGYSYAGFGRVLKTTDNGENWGELNTPTDMFYNDINFLNENTGYLVGDQGMILKTTNGGGNFVIGISNNGNTMPSEFELVQNYPNPFNPNTKINYSVSKQSFVEIKVYDILGREVETLVNDMKNIGIYEINWNGANYPSGIYFCRMKAGDNSFNIKMVLIK